ncbi:sigma factor-like helix-turn-helix DNA-binding protein [Candidatus Poriferisodalis sp.]|uniref:sigma factor-like helix-turn-helix DNA-binding protein n=1 Tax=Candidatus Poriferisodalis sp. TaxID=3101277 RepID=UPI003B01CA3F
MTAIMAVCMLGAHDQEWFRGVYSETYRPLLAYARRRVDHATADEADRDVLMLVAWEELSHAEIGQALGISANALATRVQSPPGSQTACGAPGRRDHDRCERLGYLADDGHVRLRRLC